MESETRKPFVRYSFFRVDGEWRRLSERERRVGRAQLVEAVAELGSTMDILSYSLIGTRADVDFMLWQISPAWMRFRAWLPAFSPPEWGDSLPPPTPI